MSGSRQPTYAIKNKKGPRHTHAACVGGHFITTRNAVPQHRNGTTAYFYLFVCSLSRTLAEESKKISVSPAADISRIYVCFSRAASPPSRAVPGMPSLSRRSRSHIGQSRPCRRRPKTSSGRDG